MRSIRERACSAVIEQDPPQKTTANSVKILDSQLSLSFFIFIVYNFAVRKEKTNE